MPAVAIYAEMKRASVPRFGVVTVIAMAICTTAYAITGSFGYLTFGAKVKGDVLLNYDADDVLVNLARVMLTLIVLSTAAVVLFCGRFVHSIFVIPNSKSISLFLASLFPVTSHIVVMKQRKSMLDCD